MEENQALRRHIQAELSSSWHSTRTPMEFPMSPASFGLGHQLFEAAPGQLLKVQTGEPSIARDLPGPSGSCQDVGWVPEVAQGQLHSLARTRPPTVQALGPCGLIRGLGELGAAGLSGAGSGPMRGMTVHQRLFCPCACSQPCGRRFEFSSVLEGVCCRGFAFGFRGFREPRFPDSSFGLEPRERFDAEGYPLSPGGTSIQVFSVFWGYGEGVVLRVASGISGVAGKSGSASGMTRGLSGIESRGVKNPRSGLRNCRSLRRRILLIAPLFAAIG